MITREMAALCAAQLGVEAAAVLAVGEVESSNSGFLPDGRPSLLFEAQWFHNFTHGQFDASHPGISSPVWDRSLYRGGAAEHDRLFEALALDAEAAFKSASWGAFQIMGFNHKACGYDRVDAFVSAMKQSIDNHLQAFASFIRYDSRLLAALRAKDWEAFARIYNGPGAVAVYSAKIATAYQLHAKVDAAFDAAIPAVSATLPPPDFAGPPLPTHDAITPPPTGYVESATGNMVRENVEDSAIVKGAKVGQVITGAAGVTATAAGAASQMKGVLGGISDVGAICLTAVALALIVGAFVYFRGVATERRNMNKQGIA